MSRVLIVATSHGILGQSGLPTGLWLSELTHPYHELAAAGFQVDVASPLGGVIPIDPYSDPASPLTVAADDAVSRDFLASPTTYGKLREAGKVGAADGNRYAAVLFAGGGGAIFDFALDPEITRLVERAWSTGRVVSSLCRGAAALLDARRADGAYLVQGETVTALSNEEERISRASADAPSLPFRIEDELIERGARFTKAPPFTPHVVISGGGRLVTGQQRASGRALGRALVELLSAAGD